MAVANETIINKMITELNQAKENELSPEKMVKHIANVRLLCDLFLEEDSVKPDAKAASQAELKAMIGEEGMNKQLHHKEKSSIDHDDANGDSLFDF